MLMSIQDVNIFMFVSSEKEAARVKPLTYDEGIRSLPLLVVPLLTWFQGAPAGAASIDQAALDYMISRMRNINLLDKDSAIWALEAVQAGFAAIKHDYGRSKPKGGYFLLPVPGLAGLQPPSEDFELAGKGSQEVLFKIHP